MREYSRLAYVPALWDAAKLMNGLSCSDDDFTDFRAWLISCGQEVYLSALRDPDSLAGISSPTYCAPEHFSYLPDGIYEKKTRQRFIPRKLIQLDPATRESIYADIQYAKGVDRLHNCTEVLAALPRLCEKFGYSQADAPAWPEWLPAAYKETWGSATLLEYNKSKTHQRTKGSMHKDLAR